MDLRHLLESAIELIGSLTPSLIGSAVAQAWKPALPFRQRFLQWVVGSTVSYYATIAIIAVTGWNRRAVDRLRHRPARLRRHPAHCQGRDRHADQRAGPPR